MKSLFLFLCVYSITCRNRASILNFRVCYRMKSEYPWNIIEIKS
ncbi:Uncharacterized protein FWK35_00019042 [Aphis craccivora]|uniref:Uncharacterized protein n=1 Tax=Aphis craccivora TaxID=307492 RepID=A0A6G0YFY9_APHCR|nr:Uncharacterized protein FWK35_00019042 [Aphis craccivora]